MKSEVSAAPRGQTAGVEGAPEERYFLEGPHSRKWELLTLFRIMVEFIRGFRVLHFVGPCVTT